jgi:hypothetical protein
MDVNDDAYCLEKCAAFEFIALTKENFASGAALPSSTGAGLQVFQCPQIYPFEPSKTLCYAFSHAMRCV